MLGLIGKKVGMTQVYDENGVMTPVTVIKFEDNVVVGNRSVEKDGYEACVLGTVDKKTSRVTKPYGGQFPEGVEPKQYLYEMRDFDLEGEIGKAYGVEVLENLKFVDIIGTTKGKGYQGVMKRHGFGGGRKTHGSKFHRANGSTGMAAYPSKVIKGTKMPGRMGGERKTVQNLKVVRVDAEKQIILVKGAVPGARDSVVLVRRAKKK
ncbi:MAG: 50S ribosomal protein L3 [Spirochaetales bacterium]|nr:50S ribosomal protein L3 [Spirochaetales bacterium]